MSLRSLVLIFASLLFFVPTGLTAQVVLNQSDTFQDGSLNGWSSGANNPNPPVNIASGGPSGAADRYMRAVSTGGSGAGSKLVVQNTVQWTGDFTGAGVTLIRMNVNNEGSTTLQLRLVFLGSSGSGVSTSPIIVGAGSGWTPVIFPVTAGDLTGSNVASTLAGVTEMRLIHSTTTGTKGEPIVAQLGVDDVTATQPTSVTADRSGLPGTFSLGQNYPNPFNPSTTISYNLPVRSMVHLQIFNILGQQVVELVNGEENAGYRSVTWNADVPSGIFFYRIEATSIGGEEHFTAVRKLTVMK